jgi:hypothetical protein
MSVLLQLKVSEHAFDFSLLFNTPQFLFLFVWFVPSILLGGFPVFPVHGFDDRTGILRIGSGCPSILFRLTSVVRIKEFSVFMKILILALDLSS